MFELGRKFFLNIGIFDKVALIFHRDVDGMSSASIVILAMKEMGLERPETFAATNSNIGQIIKKVKSFDKIIIVDIDIVYLKQLLLSLDKEIFIVDHHPPRKDLNAKKIIYINPHFENPGTYQPASYLIYKFFSNFLNIKNVEWKAVVGTAGDFGYEDCKDLLDKWMKIKDKKEIWKTEFGRAAITLNGAATTIGYETVLEEFLKLKNVNEVFENEKIASSYGKFLKKYEMVKKQFAKNMKEMKELNLIISEIKSMEKQRFGSPLVTELSTKYPKKIIILISKENGLCTINARYAEGKIHMGKLMEKCCKGIGGGGGHKQAAGGSVPSNKVEMFEKRLMGELKEFFKTK